MATAVSSFPTRYPVSDSLIFSPKSSEIRKQAAQWIENVAAGMVVLRWAKDALPLLKTKQPQITMRGLCRHYTSLQGPYKAFKSMAQSYQQDVRQQLAISQDPAQSRGLEADLRFLVALKELFDKNDQNAKGFLNSCKESLAYMDDPHSSPPFSSDEGGDDDLVVINAAPPSPPSQIDPAMEGYLGLAKMVATGTLAMELYTSIIASPNVSEREKRAAEVCLTNYQSLHEKVATAVMPPMPSDDISCLQRTLKERVTCWMEVSATDLRTLYKFPTAFTRLQDALNPEACSQTGRSVSERVTAAAGAAADIMVSAVARLFASAPATPIPERPAIRHELPLTPLPSLKEEAGTLLPIARIIPPDWLRNHHPQIDSLAIGQEGSHQIRLLELLQSLQSGTTHTMQESSKRNTILERLNDSNPESDSADPEQPKTPTVDLLIQLFKELDTGAVLPQHAANFMSQVLYQIRIDLVSNMVGTLFQECTQRVPELAVQLDQHPDKNADMITLCNQIQEQIFPESLVMCSEDTTSRTLVRLWREAMKELSVARLKHFTRLSTTSDRGLLRLSDTVFRLYRALIA